MKRIAAIFLFIFTLVLIVPAVQSFVPDTKVSIFNPDEEKSGKDVSVKATQKETKDYPFQLTHPVAITLSENGYMHEVVSLVPSPCLEKNTPPPNFA